MLLFQPIVARFTLIGQFIFFMRNRSLDPDIVEKHTNNPIKCISTITDLKQDFDMKSVNSFETSTESFVQILTGEFLNIKILKI